MKTYEEFANEYGTVALPMGEEIALIQQPYADYCPINRSAYYATGQNRSGDEIFEIKWPIINHECEDETDACDWDDYTFRKIVG